MLLLHLNVPTFEFSNSIILLKILLFLAGCFLSLAGHGQKDHLVKVNGDTIWGEITIKNKVILVDGSTAFAPDEVSRISSRNYRGNTVLRCNLVLYSDNLSDLELDYIKMGSIDTILVLDEIYTTPKMNLYYVTNKLKSQFYFYKMPSDPKPVQLVVRYHLEGGLGSYGNNPTIYRGEKGRLSLVEDKGYVNQLYAIMGNCRKISPTMWDMLIYRDYSFKKLIKKYNQCK